MSSKRRVRANSCKGKVKHPTMAGAWIAAGKTDPGVKPYRCKWCSMFHVGHEPGKQKRRRTVHA